MRWFDECVVRAWLGCKVLSFSGILPRPLRCVAACFSGVLEGEETTRKLEAAKKAKLEVTGKEVRGGGGGAVLAEQERQRPCANLSDKLTCATEEGDPLWRSLDGGGLSTSLWWASDL